MQKLADEPPKPLKALPWHIIWLLAVNRPGVDTFRSLIDRPEVTSKRALIWVGASSGICYAVSSILQTFVVDYLMVGGPTGYKGLGQGNILLFIGLSLILALVWAALAAGGFLLITRLSHSIAMAFDGHGDREVLGYALGAFIAPLTVISALVAVIPLTSMTVLVFCLYGMVLAVLAMRAVYNLTWPQSVSASTPVWVGLFVGAVVFSVALGPSMGMAFFYQPPR